MMYEKGQLVKFKNKYGKIVFYYPEYTPGRNAYTIEYIKDKLHRLCYEDELSPIPEQISLFDLQDQ